MGDKRISTTGNTVNTNKSSKAVPDSIKALSTKNQLSKTSIELEYSKFENNSAYLNAATAAKMQPTAKKSSLPRDRGTGANS